MNSDEKKKNTGYQEHLLNKTIAREVKQAFKVAANDSPNKRKCIVFDLQKVLQAPLGENSDFYYYSKFSVYDLSCYGVTSKQGYCFVWNETIAKRGPNEIASCIFKFISLCCTEDDIEISLFADSSSGQNKNRFIVQMMSIVIQKFKNIKSIHLSFLERGHTQNENDSVHSVIERSKKGVSIYHPYQWTTLIENACKSRPYLCIQWSRKNLWVFKQI